MPGITLVISPLIALMKDQVARLKQKKIAAEMIVSGMHLHDIDRILDNCVFGHVKLLYLSPERLASELLIERLKRMEVSFIAVDEAHCISQWGYDFRPAYTKIKTLRSLLPGIPVLALTATATLAVQDDIVKQLLFRQWNLFKASFLRANIHYAVHFTDNKYTPFIQAARKPIRSGIVYVRTRRQTKYFSDLLNKNSVSASAYHAGLSDTERGAIQKSWTDNEVQFIVATNAFGMGIDKPDVDAVIHISPPDSIEAYYQETGRVGRDGGISTAILFFDHRDIEDFDRNTALSFPDLAYIKNIYHQLGNYYQLAYGSGEGQSFNFDLSDFCKRFQLHPTQVHQGMKFLERSGFFSLSDGFYNPSKVKINTTSEVLIGFKTKHPEYANLIQQILRNYPGVFDLYLSVREEDLARKSGISPGEATAMLGQLQKHGLIHYVAKTTLPQLFFLGPRLEEKALNLDTADYAFRKEIREAQVTAVKNFVLQDNLCRKKVLLAYFGETLVEDCGHCDVCDAKMRSNNSAHLDENILRMLAVEETSIQKLVGRLSQHKKEVIIERIRFFSDQGRITFDPMTNTARLVKK